LSTASETVDETGAEAPPRPGLVLRLKRLLAAPVLLLRRLRRRQAETEGEEAEGTEAGARGAGREETTEETAAPTAPPLWRRLLPYGLILLAGAAAGGGAINWLSAQVIARQAAELGEQQAEVERLKGLVAGYDKLTLQNKKKLEEEQGRRAELENRLALAQADLIRQPSPAASRPGTARPSAGQAEADKSGNCTLRPGTVGNTLKDCLAEFNRP
jgi:hypothetical protein